METIAEKLSKALTWEELANEYDKNKVRVENQPEHYK